MNAAAVKIHANISSIPAAVWDALGRAPVAQTNPFVRHAFLKALEDSHSVGGRTGWRPAHAVLEIGGRIAGVAPVYVKSHSYGEYIFDQGWAEALDRAGGRYYPKLLCAVPFTPATGPRLLCGGDARLEDELARGIQLIAAQNGLSSAHLNFVPGEVWRRGPSLGYLQRQDQQFHWTNEGYASFGEFLAALSSMKRKNLRRERATAIREGITIEWVTGGGLREAHWDAFFEFYMETGNRKWGRPYLTREFFSRIGESMPDGVLLVLAKREGRYIAGALNFIGADALYGRNWGAIEHHPCLHFELCYYQAIDFAIAHGIKRVEAGAQGGHKLARGYLPVPTYSLHWIADEGFRRAVARYLEQEREDVNDSISELSDHSPFRHVEEER